MGEGEEGRGGRREGGGGGGERVCEGDKVRGAGGRGERGRGTRTTVIIQGEVRCFIIKRVLCR